jgi:hypothetical protein
MNEFAIRDDFKILIIIKNVKLLIELTRRF